MKHKTLSTVLAAPLLLILGFASPGAAADIETDKLTCAFTFWPGQGVYFLAQELGYFDEEGVEIDLIHEDDIQVQTEAMDAGSSTATPAPSASTRVARAPRKPRASSSARWTSPSAATAWW